MTIAMVPGSFDPITVGHVDIIERASHNFEKVVVAIMENPRKNATFTESERQRMAAKSLAHLENVSVIVGRGLTVQEARRNGATVLVRGIRAVADYEYELQQATANMMLDKQIETIFYVARPEFSFLSSSVAKEIALNGGDISAIIPDIIKDEVMYKFTLTVG